MAHITSRTPLEVCDTYLSRGELVERCLCREFAAVHYLANCMEERRIGVVDVVTASDEASM